jgi:hypothetical protein
MSRSAPHRRRIFWMLCACALFVPQLAAAGEKPLFVDFDGDGHHDRVMVGAPNEASNLRVWLSASQAEQLIRTRSTVLQVVFSDLDGDHRPELIARDSKSRIHVWTRKGRKFHSYRPRPTNLGALLPGDHSVQDSDEDRPGATTSPRVVPFSLLLSPSPRAPNVTGAGTLAPEFAHKTRTSTLLEPFAPRPPPAPAIS